MTTSYDILTVLQLAAADELYLEVTGRPPERPGRDPELAAAVHDVVRRRHPQSSHTPDDGSST